MLPENRTTTHPGEVFLLEFLEPLGQTQRALAAHMGVSTQRINELVRGKRGTTPETAWLLSQCLGTTPEFWMNLQTNHELSAARPRSRIGRLRSGNAMRQAGEESNP